jgi:hypothetical protein
MGDTIKMSDFEVPHYNVKTIKILTGDSSDNIDGIFYLGEKTLIKFFPELLEKEVELSDILSKGEELLKENKDNKSLQNLLSGKTKDGIFGDEYYVINKKLIDLDEPLINQEGKDLVDILDPRFATLNQGLKNLNRPETIKIADQSLAKISDTTNKLQNKIVNLISEKKISPDQAGEILGRNSQKIFNEALQARRAKAAPLYRKGLESGTKIDLDTVLTQNTAEISDLLGVAEKKLTLKNLLNSPVIKNSISQSSKSQYKKRWS